MMPSGANTIFFIVVVTFHGPASSSNFQAHFEKQVDERPLEV